MVLPEDYEEEFDVYIEAGGYWGRVHSKMFCGDKVVFWRACRTQLLALADEIRITGTPVTLTSTMTQQTWTIESIGDLRAWTTETDRSPVFDEPRTDPHLLTAESGFHARLPSHLNDADSYSLRTGALVEALAELQSGARHITVCNLVTNDEQTLASRADIVQWTFDHHYKLGVALQG